MKKALILHAWFSRPADNWYPWLKNELEKKGYEVWVPKLPTMDTNAPDMETMLKLVMEKGFVDEDTIVIGHSLGSVLALRLAERIKFAKGILLAAWDYNDLTPEHQSFWKTMMDHGKIKESVKDWVFLISDNDPYVTKFIAHEVAGRVNGKAVDVGARGHFGEDDKVTEVPEILEFV
ncbi:MAG: alpha/beta fold hydrolase [bacterium]